MTLARPVLAGIVRQHVDDAIGLRTTRSAAVRSPSCRLLELARADERLAAHLDGIAVAGQEGQAMAESDIDMVFPASLFVASIEPLRRGDSVSVLQLAERWGPESPAAWRMLASAVGWVSPACLGGWLVGWLGGGEAQRWLAWSGVHMHRVQAAAVWDLAATDPCPAVRQRALRAAGEAALTGRRAACTDLASHDPDPACRAEAAIAAVLLGDRGVALEALRELVRTVPDAAGRAWHVLSLASEPAQARDLVRALTSEGARLPALRAAGWAGDLRAADWLVAQMDDGATACEAGAAFSLLTGADLVRLNLVRTGDVAEPDEDGRPWPDAAKVAAWWQQHRTAIGGARVLAGRPADSAGCVATLRHGTQPMRASAALRRTLVAPGTPLFDVAAPAWRQQRVLAAM